MPDVLLIILSGITGAQCGLLLNLTNKITRLETKLPYIEGKLKELDRRKS